MLQSPVLSPPKPWFSQKFELGENPFKLLATNCQKPNSAPLWEQHDTRFLPSYPVMSSQVALPNLLRRTLRRLEEQMAPEDPALRELKSSIVRSIAELEVQREEPLLRKAS